MYAKPRWKIPDRKVEVAILSVLFFMLLFSAYYFIFFARYHPGKILEKALSHMECGMGVLGVVISEEGTDYRIKFEGSILDSGSLHGKIEDFDLELYRPKGGELLIKDLKDGLWKRASELGLKSLATLIHLPFDLSETCSHLSPKAKFRDSTQKTKTLIALAVPPEYLVRWYPNIGTPGEELSADCVVSVNRETFFIDEIEMSFTDKKTSEKLFKRNFSFCPQRNNSFKTIYPQGS